jgi:hypothetical protein
MKNINNKKKLAAFKFSPEFANALTEISVTEEIGKTAIIELAVFELFKEYFVQKDFALLAKSWGTKYARRSFSDRREGKDSDRKGVRSRFILDGTSEINADRQGGALALSSTGQGEEISTDKPKSEPRKRAKRTKVDRASSAGPTTS